MLNFLTPPTDNLYKFIAITGLLFIFASIFYPTFLNIQINERILESEKDIEIATIERTKLERESNDIERKANDMQKKVEGFKQNPSNVFAKQLEAEMKDLEQLQKQTKEFTDVATELQKRNIEIEYKNKITKFYNNYLELALNAAQVGMTIGLILTFLGFTLWFFKVQKHQDLVLLKEAEQKQISAGVGKRIPNLKNPPKTNEKLTSKKKDDALKNLMKSAGAESSGNPRSADNEQIDADLAKEYGKDL